MEMTQKQRLACSTKETHNEESFNTGCQRYAGYNMLKRKKTEKKLNQYEHTDSSCYNNVQEVSQT